MEPSISLPNLPEDLPVSSIENFQDDGDTFAEYAHIKDCVITLEERRLFECRTVRFTNVRFDDLHLAHTYLHQVIFDKCTFINTKFIRSSFKHVQFINCRMNGILISDSLLEHVEMKESILNLASFGFLSFKSVLFNQCPLQEAEFLDLSFKHVAFSQCDLNKARFNQTSLDGVDLSSSDFNQLTVSPEAIKGAIVNQTQAWAFLKLLGIIIKED